MKDEMERCAAGDCKLEDVDCYENCSYRKSNRSQKAKASLISRLNRIEGQVRGVQRMIEEEADCGEILNQIAAIKAAVHHAGIIMFENHAQECILKSFNEEDKEKSLDEIIKVMGRFIK
jgi:DNA-binding FrmR family transcriptional regulator